MNKKKFWQNHKALLNYGHFLSLASHKTTKFQIYNNKGTGIYLSQILLREQNHIILLLYYKLDCSVTPQPQMYPPGRPKLVYIGQQNS